MIPFLSVKPSAIRMKVKPQFPADLLGGTAIVISKANGIYTINLNYEELQAAAIGVAANDYVAIWDSVSGQFFRIKLSDMGAIVGAVSSVFGRAGAVVAQANDYTFAQLAAKPTTLGGYGITDAVLKSGDTMTGVLGVPGLDISVAGAQQGRIVFPATANISANANTLDDYEEGTWTPGLTFGGGSVGMTGSFAGQYTKTGNIVRISGSVALSAKGSSTGVALMTGLPFAHSAFQTCVSIYLDNMAATVGDTMIISLIGGGATTVQPYKMVSGLSSAQMTHADFSNTSYYIINGVIQTPA